MDKHVVSTLAIATGLLVASGHVVSAQEKMTIGISYQNLAFPYVAALQKAAENACKALGVDCVEADAVNDTNKELEQCREHAGQGRELPGVRGGEPRRFGRVDRGRQQEGRAGRSV